MKEHLVFSTLKSHQNKRKLQHMHTKKIKSQLVQTFNPKNKRDTAQINNKCAPIVSHIIKRKTKHICIINTRLQNIITWL